MLFLRRKVVNVLGTYDGRMYTSVATMFFESGALYTSIEILYLACKASGIDAQVVVMQPLGQAVVSSKMFQCATVTLTQSHTCDPVGASLLSSYFMLHEDERGRRKRRCHPFCRTCRTRMCKMSSDLLEINRSEMHQPSTSGSNALCHIRNPIVRARRFILLQTCPITVALLC